MSTLFTQTREHVFVWKIENFKSSSAKNGESLSSPIFVADSLDKSAWCLKFYPRGFDSTVDNCVACFLQRKGDIFENVEVIRCEFQIDVIGEKDEILFSNKKTENFGILDSHGWSKYEEKNLFLREWEKLSENTLTIRCQLFSHVPRVKFFSENTAITKVGVDHCTFRCEIENANTSTNLKLLTFPSSGTNQIEVLIQIPDDDIEISIRRKEGFTVSQCVTCKVSLLDLVGEIIDSKSETHLFETFHLNQNALWEFPTFLKKSRLAAEKNKYLVNDRFTLIFEISVSNGSKYETIRNIPSSQTQDNLFDLRLQQDCSMVMLKADLSRLFTENIQSDLNLRVQDQVFPAHKAILSARSPVFFAMFNHDMAEKQTGDVDIPDLEAETMKSFLKFLYTGETESMDYVSASKLMITADKYQICTLKEKCAIFLKSILSIENVCDILILADLVGHKILKASAIEFVVKHSGYIFCSSMWKSVVQKNLLLASETVSEVSLFLAANQKEKNPETRYQLIEKSCKPKREKPRNKKKQ